MQSAANRRASLGPSHQSSAAETLQGTAGPQVDADRVASGNFASFSGRAAVPGDLIVYRIPVHSTTPLHHCTVMTHARAL